MQTLPLPRLAALLRANAKGYYATEAATELLIGHESWLRRTDFLRDCVWVTDRDGNYAGPPVWTGGSADALNPDDVTSAHIFWDDLAGYADTAPCSGGEARILRLAAELAGHDTGIPLGELLSSLDDRNGRLVVDAIAHALHLPEPYEGAGQ